MLLLQHFTRKSTPFTYVDTHAGLKALNQTYQVYQGSSVFVSLHLVKMLMFIRSAPKGRGLYDLHSTTAHEYQNFLYGIHTLERTFKRCQLFVSVRREIQTGSIPNPYRACRFLCEMKALTKLQDSQDCSTPGNSRSTIRAAPIIQYLSQMKVLNRGPTRCQLRAIPGVGMQVTSQAVADFST